MKRLSPAGHILRSLLLPALMIPVAFMGCQTTVSPALEAPPDNASFFSDDPMPPSAETLYRMARLLVARGRDVQAQDLLSRCLSDHPDFLPAYVELADLHIRAKRFDQAIATLEKGLAQAPEDSVLRSNLGMCLFIMADYAGALEWFELAASQSPDDGRYLANIALAKAMVGRYDEALMDYRGIVSEGEAHYNLAVICRARADHDRAAEEFAAAALLGFFGDTSSPNHQDDNRGRHP